MNKVYRFAKLTIAIAAAGWGVAGCARFDRSSSPAAQGDRAQGNDGKGVLSRVLRNAARAVLTGSAYDRATIAARNENRAALGAAIEELQRYDAGHLAQNFTRIIPERLVGEASELDGLAQSLSGVQRDILRARAAAKYREALRLSPRFDSPDPLKLNALGYFLAERGTTPQDFKEAERLTRRAVQILDEAIEQLGPSKARLANFRMMRAITRDSVAWALYRQGRYEEARREQENAMLEILAVTPAAGADAGLSEMYFHLGEIYRALKIFDKARRQYEAALKSNPQDEASRRALQALPPVPASPSVPAVKPVP